MSGARRLARIALWPLFVAATTAAFVATALWGHQQLGLAAVPLVTIVALFALELWLPDRAGHSAWRDPQGWNDVAHAIVGQGGGNALGQAVFVFSAAWAAGELGTHFGLRLWPTGWPGWLQVLLVVFVADGLDYLRHRLSHEVPWLWPVHALHHAVDRMNVLKASRGHFTDMLFRNAFTYAPLALAGVPTEILLAHAAAVTVFGPIAHANVDLRVPGWLHRFVTTPQVHRIHHARPLLLSNRNYANVFPFWDLLFGTFAHPDHTPGFAYGCLDDGIPDDWWGQTWAPFASWRRRRGAAAPEAPLHP